jgi:NAD(P)H-hydrate repair Nnr-like enzyme with NAD(P)H-hydrate dehydratase domain
VLKGSGTVIAAPSKPCWVNTTGHAALGTAGTGDVLAGWIGGLMAQCPEAPSDELAAIAVAWHGAAADRMPLGSGPLTAGQLISEMSALYP